MVSFANIIMWLIIFLIKSEKYYEWFYCVLLACVTFYTEYSVENDSEKLFLSCLTPDVAQWHNQVAHNTRSKRHWSTAALLPMGQDVKFRWGVVESGECRYEAYHTSVKFSSDRYVVLKSFNGAPMIRPHASDILLKVNGKGMQIFF